MTTKTTETLAERMRVLLAWVAHNVEEMLGDEMLGGSDAHNLRAQLLKLMGMTTEVEWLEASQKLSSDMEVRRKADKEAVVVASVVEGVAKVLEVLPAPPKATPRKRAVSGRTRAARRPARTA